MSSEHITAYARYLPVEADSFRWGMHVVDCGFTEVPAYAPYPPEPHPPQYLFSWNKGRTLSEYQLVYITEGRGIFESKPTGTIEIEAGDVFFLFPGIWHRYCPAKEQGWDENWIGFDGEYAHRLMEGFFQKERAVIHVGHDWELLNLIRSVGELLQQARAGYQQLMAARTIETLARIRAMSLGQDTRDRTAAEKIQQARRFLLEHSTEDVDIHGLAKKLGLSYSRFRNLFKSHTGSAPNQYQIEIRINKSRELLAHSSLNITEIADCLGFSSVYYFSRLFRKKQGCSPKQYREQYKAL